MRFLLCEDEPKIARFIRQGLSEEGHEVVWLLYGQETIRRVAQERFDAVILDVRLPDTDGMTVCREIRRIKPLQPVLMLTAMDAIEDRVAGLRSGADDYLTKPFAFEELTARLEALCRRSHQQGGAALEAGGFKVDPYSRACTWQDVSVPLTPREFDLMAYFVAHPDRTIPRETIYREVWHMPFDPNTNVIEVYVRYLRRALSAAGCPDCIETVRGVGYHFNTKSSVA